MDAQAMAEARDRALQTPEEVRKAFLGTRHTVPGLALEPWSIAIMWILEEIDHPLIRRPVPLLDAAGQPVLGADKKPTFQAIPITARDLARGLYAFSDSEGAFDALCEGIASFDRRAFSLMRSLPPQSVHAADALIPTIIKEGLATLPGAGGGNPPKPAGPLAPPKTTASAGS